jgi:hypothetical protein
VYKTAYFRPCDDPLTAALAAQDYSSFSTCRCSRLCQSGGVMGTIQDHRKYAEECVAMARLSQAESDKALWLTLAQSWVRLAEHVARAELNQPEPVEIGEAS